MPNGVNIYWDEKSGDWDCYVFSDNGDWDKRIWHKDLDPPKIDTLAFVAHQSEIMELLRTEDRQPSLEAMVLRSCDTLRDELEGKMSEEIARKNRIQNPEEE